MIPYYIFVETGPDGQGDYLVNPALPVTETEYVSWVDPVVTPGVWSGGQDASLAAYLGASEQKKEAFAADSGALSDSFGAVRSALQTEIDERASVQGGGYGVPGARVVPRRHGALLPWVILGGILWWSL